MRNLLHLIFLYKTLLTPMSGFAQCGNLDILIDDEACQSSFISISNNSVGISEYQYDFCVGDMNNTASASFVDNYSSIGRSDGVDIIREGNSYYGFLLASSGKLFRLDFGSSLANTPTVNDLGSIIGGFDISFIEDSNGTWHGYVASGNSKIYRIDFDLGIESAISFVDLGNFGGIISSPRGIRAQKTGNDIYVYVTSSNLNTLSIIKFTGGVNGLSISRSIAITGGSQIVGIDLKKECNFIYAILSAVTNRKIYRVSLGSDVMDGLQTSIQEITSLAGVQTYELDIIVEGSKTYLLLPSFAGSIYQANFESSITNSPTIENRGNFGLLDKILGSEFINDSSRVYGFTYNYITFDFSMIEYKNSCNSEIPYSESTTPIGVTYTSSGKKYIEIKGVDNLGNTTIVLDSINIFDVPLTDFEFTKACLGEVTEFTDASSSMNGDISTWNWNFDGLGTSTLQNPTFLFASTGVYNISLTATDFKGCSYTRVKSIKLYPENDIVVDFNYPSIKCTNAEINFTDESVYTEDIIQSWFWSFNGEGNSTFQNPNFIFTSSGTKNITLSVTGISGCTYSSTQQINIEVGPTTAFGFDNLCNATITTFTDQTTGTNLTSWNWNFGDGTTSTEQNTFHTYALPGNYDVTLIVANNEGCFTSATRTVVNYSNPVAKFKNDLPCSTTPIQFTDQSLVDNANIIAWEWGFGDGTTSTEQHPEHLFGQLGDFEVKLKAFSQFGCVDSTQTMITIAQGPEVDFEWDKSCEGEATSFTDMTNSFSRQITNWNWIINGVLHTSQNPMYTFDNSGTYTIQLTVTLDNLCTQTLSQDIIIEVPPLVQFGFEEDCATLSASFYDLTNQANDAIIAREWRVDGALFSSDTVASTQLDPGNYDITLSVITVAGCEETNTSTVTLNGSPVAGFSTNTNYGATPLLINFSNSSSGGSNYLWSFNDVNNSISIDQNPSFIFTDIGEYTVTLRTSSALDCYDETTKKITVVAPVTLAKIIAITPVLAEDKTNFILTIENEGSTLLTNSTSLVFRSDYGAEVIEPLNTILYAGKTINYTPAYAIATSSATNNLCVTLVSTENIPLNESCITLGASEIISEPYPNPSTGNSSVDVILEKEQVIKVRLINRAGQPVFANTVQGQSGLNKITIDGINLPQGLYIIEIITSSLTEQRKLSITR